MYYVNYRVESEVPIHHTTSRQAVPAVLHLSLSSTAALSVDATKTMTVNVLCWVDAVECRQAPVTSNLLVIRSLSVCLLLASGERLQNRRQVSMSDDAIVFAAVAESICQPHSLDLVKTSPNFFVAASHSQSFCSYHWRKFGRNFHRINFNVCAE